MDYKKVLKKLILGSSLKTFKRFKRHSKICKSTILLEGSSVRVSIPLSKMEDRVYVDVGSMGIIQSAFIFESSSGYIRIGDNVHIGGATFISRSRIEVEDDVTMAWDIMVYDHNSHSIHWGERINDNIQCYEDYTKYGNNIINKDWTNVNSSPIRICSKVWIGFGVTILKGVTIGEGAVIGAKSVVTKDVPPWTVVAGNPAKIVKEIPLNQRT